MKLLFDIETDDLKATKIWCIVAKDMDSKQLYTYGPDQIEEGVQLLEKATHLIGHNIIGFDIPVVEELCNRPNLSEGKEIIDTLVLSRLFNPSREGGHGLGIWGTKLGLDKIGFEEFSRYSKEMLEYCIRDVELNEKIYYALREESKGFSKDSLELEHSVAKILKDQEKHGFLFDVREAEILMGKLRSNARKVEMKVKSVFKPKIDELALYPRLTKAGKVSKTADKNFVGSGEGARLTESEHNLLRNNLNLAGGCLAKCPPVSRLTTIDFNLNSRVQIGEYLQEFGWKPTEFTVNGRPIVNEKTLAQVKNIPEADLINNYLLHQKRISQIDSWLKAVEEDDRVHGFVIPNGAVTGRMTHRDPNMAQVPNSSSPYGKECRACWTVPDGYKLVGIDASGLELRMLAHFMDDEEYTNEIINGDIHTANQKLARLESRNQAKTFIYALCYGAGDLKLSTILGGSAADAKRTREHFLDNLPSFRSLKNKVARAADRGYLKGLDGRKLFVRSEHSALNTLLQGAGAIVMKKALTLFAWYIRDLDARFVANVHDEWQVEVREDHAEEVGKRGVQAIIDAGALFKLKCPLDGEYNVGRNWSETH